MRPNEKCSCGSGKKFKKCCGSIIREPEPAEEKPPQPRSVKAGLASGLFLSALGEDKESEKRLRRAKEDRETQAAIDTLPDGPEKKRLQGILDNIKKMPI